MAKKKREDGRHARSKKTEKELTKAAEASFAERGYEGASVRDIAGRAGVNAALVSYHFGGKQGLFEEVIDQTMVELGIALREAFTSEQDVVLGTRKALTVYLEHLRASDAFPKLVARSLLDGDDKILVLARSYLRPLVDLAKLRLGERALPEHEITTLFAASIVPILYAPLLSAVWGWEEDGPSIIERRHAHLIELTETLFARYGSEA